MNKALWNASLFLLAAGMLLAAAGFVLSLVYKRRETFKGHAVARIVELILDVNPLAKTDDYQKFATYTSCQFAKLLYEKCLPFE